MRHGAAIFCITLLLFTIPNSTAQESKNQLLDIELIFLRHIHGLIRFNADPLKFSLLIENVSSPGLLANNESQIDFFETSTSVILLFLNDK